MTDIPKIEAKRSWNIPGLEKLIVKKKLYTNRTPGHYERMMDYVSSTEPTYEALYRVAWDIQLHSGNIPVQEIMALLEKNAVDVAFELSGGFNPYSSIMDD